jgi:MFS family permease
MLGACFALAGIGIGCVETAEHAAVATLAPEALRGSAFGLPAAVQSFGNLIASALAGLLYTVASPAVAFSYAAALMLAALAALAVDKAARPRQPPHARQRQGGPSPPDGRTRLWRGLIETVGSFSFLRR